MAHTTKLVPCIEKDGELIPHEEGKPVIALSDEGIAVRIRCCEDEKSDSVHTLYGAHALTEEQANDWLAEKHRYVKSRHHGRERAIGIFAAIKNQTMLHD